MREIRWLFTFIIIVSASLLITPTAAAQTFQPELTPTGVTVTAGSATGATFQAAINHDAGFNSSIRVFFSAIPDGITITPTEQFLNPPYNPVTFTVKAAASVAPGSYDVPVIFSSSETKMTNLTVTVLAGAPPPDFIVSVMPDRIDVPQGEARTTSVMLTSLNGFQGTVNFSTDHNPARIEVTPSPFSLTVGPNATVMQTLTIRAKPDAAPGSANFILSAQSGTLRKGVPVFVNIAASGPPPDFTIALSQPNPASVVQGGSTRVSVTATGLNGFTSPIAVMVSATAGVTANPASFTMNPGETREVTLSVPSTTPAGTVTVNVAASSGTLQKTASTSFSVTAAAQPDFTLAATPPVPPSVQPGGTSRVTVTATPTNGFNGTIQVMVQAPAGVTASPASFTLAPGSYSREVTLTSAADATAGAHVVTFSATSGTLQRNATTTLIVSPAASGAPVIEGVSPHLPVPTPSQVVYLVGRNFAPGAIATSATPGVFVEQTIVRSPTVAEVVVTVRQGVTPGRYRIDLRNPDGATTAAGGFLILRDRSDLGGPLGVTTAAIVYPVQGTIVATGEEVYPRALLATTGTGTVVGYWALDGVPFDRFTATVAGGRLVTSVGRCPRSEGEAPQVCSNVPVPPLSWGPSHRLELFIESPQKAGSPVVTLIGASQSATRMTIYEPVDGSEIDGPARFRWTLMPGATGYELEFVEVLADGDEREPRLVRFRTARSEWTPRRKDLERLGTGTFRWRVRAIRPGDVRDEPTEWVTVTIRAAAIAARVAQLAYAGDSQDIPIASEVPHEAPAPPPEPTYALAPEATITGGKDEDISARAQMSTQGEIGSTTATSKFTGDLSYAAGFDPGSLIQESRNWVIQGGSPEGAALGGDVRLGYTTPDFTDGAEYLTSGLARTGVVARASSRFGTLSYYQPVNTAVHGVTSGNPENLDIHSMALATPEGRPYVLRLIGLAVDEPDDEVFGTIGSRLRSIGVYGRYDISPRVALVAEVAHGSVEGIHGNTDERDGSAMRLGLNGTLAGATYGFNLRSVGANFVNPANRGLTPGGVSDRVAADLNLSRMFGRASVNLTVQRQEQGKSDESTLPDTDQTTISAGVNTMLGRVSMNVSANMISDRGDADPNSFMPETSRDNRGVTATFSETFGRFSLSQTLGIQRMQDDINPLSDQDTSSVTFSASGALLQNFNISATLGGTRMESAPELGTTDNLTFSLSPSITIPAASMSLSPNVSFSRSRNDVLGTESESENYQAMLQWAPPWLGSLMAAQLSTAWSRSGFGGITTPLTQSYQASLTMRLSKTRGMPLFPGQM